MLRKRQTGLRTKKTYTWYIVTSSNYHTSIMVATLSCNQEHSRKGNHIKSYQINQTKPNQTKPHRTTPYQPMPNETRPKQCRRPNQPLSPARGNSGAGAADGKKGKHLKTQHACTACGFHHSLMAQQRATTLPKQRSLYAGHSQHSSLTGCMFFLQQQLPPSLPPSLPGELRPLLAVHKTHTSQTKLNSRNRPLPPSLPSSLIASPWCFLPFAT